MTYLKKFRCKDCLVEWIDIGKSSKCYSCGVVSDKFDSIKSYVTVTGETSETTTRDVIEEFKFYLKSNLPTPAMLAWMGTLTPEERQEVWDHVMKMYEDAMTTVTNVKETFEAAGISFMECIAAGLGENKDDQNDGGS